MPAPIPPQHVIIDEMLFARCFESALLAVAECARGETLDHDEIEDVAYETLDRYLGILALAPKEVN